MESDYAEVTEKESHPNQPSVAQAPPNVTPLERDFAVVKKKSTDETPAVGEVDGVSQARMPPAKPSPYKGTPINGSYSFVTEQPPFPNDYSLILYICTHSWLHNMVKLAIQLT